MLSLISLILQVTVASFLNFVGAASGSDQGNPVLSKSLADISSSKPLIIKPSATRGGSPKFNTDMAAPSIGVGAGGSGAKQGPSGQHVQSEGSLSDKIGQMVENSQQEQAEPAEPEPEPMEEGTVLRERAADEPPNAKKRMWEEPPPPQAAQNVRDEL